MKCIRYIHESPINRCLGHDKVLSQDLLYRAAHHGDRRGSDGFGKDGQTSDGVLKMGTLTSGVQEANGHRRTDGLKTYRPASLSPSKLREEASEEGKDEARCLVAMSNSKNGGDDTNIVLSAAAEYRYRYDIDNHDSIGWLFAFWAYQTPHSYRTQLEHLLGGTPDPIALSDPLNAPDSHHFN